MKPPYPWSARAFKRKLEQHDLTPEQGADLVGATRRTGYNWVTEGRSHPSSRKGGGPPYVVALVYELMERCNLTPADLDEIGNQLTKKRN
jgi:hypothetical protein